MVCDDDTGISEVIKIILENNNYNVLTLNTGKAIQKTIKDFKPDVLLLDLWMPGIDGEEITKILKREEATKNLPIIVISALSETAKIAKNSKADDFLPKPFDMDELLKKVKTHTS